MVQAIQFCGSADGTIVQRTYELPPIKPDEVLVKLTHSGVCGSDLHMISRSCVLGHEGIGIIEQIGAQVTGFHVGNRVGFGPINSTCGLCDMCRTGKDAYCPNVRTYSMHDPDTIGSFCSHAVRKQQWIFHIPDSLSSEDAAPLMCGGATVWVPLIEQCKSYDRIGIVGIGGLGHLAIQYARKMGADVVVFSSTEDKREEALKLGATEFYATKGVTDFTAFGLKKPLDKILITTSVKIDVANYYSVLSRTGSILVVGIDMADITLPWFPTVLNAHSIIGSCVCSQFLQEKAIDFAARNDVHVIGEKFPMTLEGVNACVEKLASGKIRYRGVLVWDN